MHLLDAVKPPVEREWYARQAIENGWSRNVLAHQIDSGLFARRGRALTNFARTLPTAQDLERGLTEHLRALILKGRNEVIVEYALRDMSKPMGVAEYRFSKALPKQLQSELPTAEDLTERIDTWLDARPTRCSTP